MQIAVKRHILTLLLRLDLFEKTYLGNNYNRTAK